MADRFGFTFWLRWIFGFAFTFIAAAVIWTLLLMAAFGAIRGTELTLTWSVAVFGSWFILVIPFMRKKEQIWKRLNQDQESAIDAWLRAMGVFVGCLVLSAFIWGLVFRSEIIKDHSGINGNWAKAVFGTWLVLFLPFLVWMYKKSDELFKTAMARQTPKGPAFKTILVEKIKRMLPETITKKIGKFSPTLEKGHVVHLILRDGKKIPHVFVMNASEVLGIYDHEHYDFDVDEVMDVELVSTNELPAYEESKWLRLDGRL